MILDVGSFMFNMNPPSGGTPSWGTDMGQGEGYKFNFEDCQSLITSLTYTCVDDMQNVKLEFGKGGSRTDDYNIILAGLYKKVYVNNKLVDGAEFMLLIAKQISNPTGFHIGRKTLKYSPNIKYRENKINENCIKLIKEQFELNEYSAWFIHEINVENQDELHMKMYIADKDKSLSFSDANERKEFVKKIVGEDIEYTKSENKAEEKDLRHFYIDNVENNIFILNEIEKRNKFVKEYPIDRIPSLTKDEYCLGLENFKNSFCYKIEFGEYRHTGFGIGGGTSGKYGFYYSGKDQAFCGKNNKVVDNPDEYWENFKQELYSFLKEMEKNEPNFVLDEKYPLLGGSGSYMYLTKLLSLYYPNRFISMSHDKTYKKLAKYLNKELGNKAIQNSYYGNIAFRKAIPEANDNDGYFVANSIWKYFNDNSEEINAGKEDDRKMGGINKIYYGVPGCGKSYQVDKVDFKPEEYYKIRTTFHPEYSNSDFVGQLVPKLKRSDESQEGKVVYEFQKGPFVEALIEAYNNPSEKVCLIIEEINRGNSSAIFGDIFQLLDRNETGESTFGINNPILEEYLRNELNEVGSDKLINDACIKIPSNMWIVATMNTSDQNVFTLDTAFKRRWKMHRVANVFDENDKIADMYVPGTDVKWRNFIEVLNTKIKNTKALGVNSEDKQLGTHFVTQDELSEKIFDINNKEKIEAFAEKVLLYIWDDVAKIKPEDWFNEKTYDDLLKKFYELNNEKLSIFKLNDELTFIHEGNDENE